MVKSDYRVVISEAGMKALFYSTDGPIVKTLVMAAAAVTTGAKRRCPVDTGRLRSSINHQIVRIPIGWRAEIGTDVEYAPYVEFGTRRMSAQPFLRPAIDDIRGRL